MRPYDVIVCVPRGSKFDLAGVTSHVANCACRRHHTPYHVHVKEHVLPAAQEHSAEEAIHRAHLCAQAALDISPRTIVGIGLERGKLVITDKKYRPFITPVATAVLLLRNQPHKPLVALVTHDHPELGKELVQLCQQQGFDFPKSKGCLLDAAAKRALEPV